ncbi:MULTISPECIES: NAD-dependent epimerase/dehydratase family protein [Glycomyces]|uniref:NAD(P)-dependent oxidoreductase n=2 Tax=Glycomyces TaxID=58113 RepID=A0A9X3SWV3_9ACTN|nr:NAD(P)-dependent oxidoreductase [Glycomyces lechevalierae]MDA1386282.1 NAD(P)-dependent oxidoreductase [Glycomyces lechevalierae]MDR7338246.1 nucleoside-diphosphate-sugar epimerase [Glycomyces lechevalierae]
MTRVAVTGGSGKLGRACVRDLVENGYEVVNLDRAPSPDDLAPFIQIDLTDHGQVVSALTGVDDRYDRLDAVVHLAAIPAPGLRPNSAIFHNNMLSTYNVFAAAKTAGIHNIVWASSETVLGLPFETPPPYLPVDEEYAPRPESTYSLVKTLEETMVDQLCRWNPELKATGLRFSNVMNVEDYAAFPVFNDDPTLRDWNLWSYIDARDGALAIRLGLEREGTGKEVFVIASPDTVMSTPTAELVETHYPDLELKRPVEGHETLLSIDKARRILGFDPKHTWRDYV